jgi:signal transduction histidine kinase/phage shock protein PspC (stress-responsive transcriptional regulator)
VPAPDRHRRLVRRRRGRVLGGVALGLADHVGVDVLVLRLAFALLVAAGGAGVLLYAGLWVFTPEEPADGRADAPERDVPQLAAFAAVAIGAAILLALLGIGSGGLSIWPVVVAAVGGALIWRQASGDRWPWLSGGGLRRRLPGDPAPRAPDRGAAVTGLASREAVASGSVVAPGARDVGDPSALGVPLAGRTGSGDGVNGEPAAGESLLGASWVSGARAADPTVAGSSAAWSLSGDSVAADRRARQLFLVRVVVGGLLVVLGVAGFLAANNALHQARQGLLAIVAVVVGLAMVTGPWWARTAGELAEERRERIRTQERAEFAARVHDSVLQTLALIQRNVEDPREVARLARAQERDLRSWLYRPADATPVDRLGLAIEQAAADVEDTYGVPIEVVVVGDADLDDRLLGLVQAAREAMLNAAKSSGASSVSVYVEVEEERVSVFVRDRGKGFDLATVGADRYGIRESIVGRMTRHGGTAEVRTAPGDGTEVRLSIGLRP